jgi:hypothetical protein
MSSMALFFRLLRTPDGKPQTQQGRPRRDGLRRIPDLLCNCFESGVRVDLSNFSCPLWGYP